MTDIPIPADVLEVARKIVREFSAVSMYEDEHEEAIARAILADRAAQAERMAGMEEAVNFVARWAWRTDPPNANNKLSDTERLSCIKHYPTIKDAAKPHIDLAQAEAIRALSQEGSE